uniref:Serine/threonine/tyrosine interacting like 1 n=1 Tax=Nothoprocta perdicaria TaxID=30464 RepID=A0A8C6ZGH6_NOTPE
MAGLRLCEPTELYNILNQYARLCRLAEPNYLCLLDARTQREFDESHIITARKIEQYLVPDLEELECVRYCVVYDGETSSLDFCDNEKEESEKVLANIRYGRDLEQFTRHPVLILTGGYRRFTACYHFLRTQKLFWMPQELDNLKPYPVEILPAKLYMGNFKQACDPKILKDLKIKAQVNISKQPTALFAEDKLLHISVADSPDADLFSHFSTISVLVFSNLGISRSSTVIMAYLMHSSQFTLKEAWEYVRKCKTNMRPNRGFVKQLSDWETRIYGITITDISEPNY